MAAPASAEVQIDGDGVEVHGDGADVIEVGEDAESNDVDLDITDDAETDDDIVDEDVKKVLTDYSSFTVPELQALLTDLGIDFVTRDTKDDLIKKLHEH